MAERIGAGDAHDELRRSRPCFDGKASLGAPVLPPSSRPSVAQPLVRAALHLVLEGFELHRPSAAPSRFTAPVIDEIPSSRDAPARS
jgi:hypothetical protein